jgi:DNA-binding CsgD family transcriptional regulator
MSESGNTDNIQKNISKEINSELNSQSQAVNMALNIIQKNESLKALSHKIDTFRANPKFEACYAELFELQNMIRETLQLDKDRNTFQLYVNENNELFYSALREKYPNLTPNEVRLSALIRLDLSSKEIASILNISSKSVEMNRYRLRKKMQLSGSVNLSEFIRSI